MKIIIFIAIFVAIIAILTALFAFAARSEIATIKRKDPAIKSSIEVILYSSFWAMFSHRIAHRLYNMHIYFLARLISQLSRWFTGIEIHPGAKIAKGVFIDHGMGVVIGETCEIGENVLIYQNVTLGGTGKDTGKRHPTVEHNVMIGSGAKVLGPITIGHDSKIGAGSVVLNSTKPYSTVVGVPAHSVTRGVSESAPSDNLDQLRLPDPVEMELCRLRLQIDKLEKQIEKYKTEDSNNEAV